MKKLIAILLLLGALGAVVYYNMPTINTAIGQFSEAVNEIINPKPKPKEATTTTFGKRDTPSPKTDADVTEAIDKEITKNPDTVGWLKIAGTTINHSVLQSNNNAYYLRLNEDKEPDIYGCYFADYESSIGKREEMSPTTVIYGHSDLKDNPKGPRFSQLFKFTEDMEFAKNTPVIEFDSAEENMQWEIFAVSYVDVNLPYIEQPKNDKDMEALIKNIRDSSIYQYPAQVSAKDKILILSTCTVKFGSSEHHRLIISAKLMPKNAELPKTVEITERKL